MAEKMDFGTVAPMVKLEVGERVALMVSCLVERWDERTVDMMAEKKGSLLAVEMVGLLVVPTVVHLVGK